VTGAGPVVHHRTEQVIADDGGLRGPAIAVEGVAHHFAGKPALDGLSLRVDQGEFCVLIGPSGCGKTTTLDAVAGEVVPTSGSVQVLGRPPLRGNRRLGYMFARDALFPWRTARENVELALEGRGVRRDERRRRAAELLDLVGLSDVEQAYPTQLSQGMRQRVALARTFACGADVLLMDEPFAALDAQTRMLLGQELTRLWERDASTVLYVTHDVTEGIVLADRIVVFSGAPGRVRSEYRVPLPRPRSVAALQGSGAFPELHQSIWLDLQDEAGRFGR
jgi:NitT/TauT family transport system ATP-binding protein